MSQIRLYLDEDSMARSLVRALRARAIDVRTTSEEGLVGCSDQEQLRWATAQQRVLFTCNVGDFYRLHTEFLTAGEMHQGIILLQQELSIGERLRGLMRLMAAKSGEDMVNQAEFLSNWI